MLLQAMIIVLMLLKTIDTNKWGEKKKMLIHMRKQGLL